MERIVLEVDSVVAKKWRSLSASQRSLYEKALSVLLQQNKQTEFLKLLDSAGKIAMANGLTDEKLAQLLDEKD
ncbi:hypothetical protein [Pedobacter endophyticus]|uniref:Uncharacterized protein n=1 Tax=Pedobacter endophyticus TaxID=2789740 RepID=A0A7S9L376_9SPHI|nr:hypothetical protein [Pedobacter endophyticus]QPH41623.1 hypothetical protein IZT61_10370 [Pedobacter endophyticus]